MFKHPAALYGHEPYLGIPVVLLWKKTISLKTAY